MNQIEQEQKPKLSKTKYELTLAEFPIFLLSKGGKGDRSEIKSIQYEDTITGRDGEVVSRKWMVYPDGKVGFGTASTLETLFDLFQIWKETNFEGQYIQFGTVYHLLKRRGQDTGQQQYKQILKDLYSLVGVRIEAKNAFWDNELKAYVDMTFHLFDQLQIYKEKATGQAILPFARIKASDVLYGSVQKNSLMTAAFDSKFFHSLTPVEQRLALYLVKVFRSQAIHKRHLAKLAEQIPLYAKQIKHVKEQLKKALAGLMKKEFYLLESFAFERAQDGQGDIVVFRRKGNPPVVPTHDPGKEEHEVKLLVEDILAVCQDPKSTHFYQKVAGRMPRETIYRALAEVREVIQLSEIKRSAGALFTKLIKNYAQQQGIDL